MRKSGTYPAVGDKRIKEFFALFPVNIRRGYKYEWRWLERVKVKQVCEIEYNGYGCYSAYWENVEFVENE